MQTMQSTRRTLRRLSGFVVLAAAVAVNMPLRGADKRIVLIAGKPSHAPGMHEFRAGSLLMQKALAGFPGVTVQVYDGGWPSKMVDGARVDDDAALDGADAVMIYADGGKGNPAIQGNRIKVIDALAAKGVGLGFAHYGVEVPAGEPGEAMHRWIGGYYEGTYAAYWGHQTAFNQFDQLRRQARKDFSLWGDPSTGNVPFNMFQLAAEIDGNPLTDVGNYAGWSSAYNAVGGNLHIEGALLVVDLLLGFELGDAGALLFLGLHHIRAGLGSRS